MKKIKFALIGCGKIGGRHAEHIFNYGVLVAVCDIVHEKANLIGNKYSANVYYSLDEL